MSNYIAVFVQPGLMVSLGVFLLLAAVGTWLARRRIPSAGRRALLFAVMAFVGLILSVTIFRDPPRGLCSRCFTDAVFGGSWGIERLVGGQLDTEALLNVALFVPLGIAATLLWTAPFRVTGAALLLSLVIELVQPLLGVGVNDLTDLATNTVGAFIGAGVAVTVRLIWDAVAARRLDRGRWLRFLVTLAVSVGMALGGSAWIASSRQQVGAQQLQALFANTTLADYQRADADASWQSKIETFWRANRMPLAEQYADDSVAMNRYTWRFYLATRCVTGRWDARGFTTLLGSGDDCSRRLGS